MEASEKEVVLDIDDFNKYMKTRWIHAISIPIVFLLFITIIIIFEDLPLLILFCIVLLMNITSRQMQKEIKIVKDFINGRKIIIHGALHKKNKTTKLFYFEIGNRKLKVNSKFFETYEVGQILEIHIAPISEYVISINNLYETSS